MRIRNERTKVGKGNRKLVRGLFRSRGIEFPFHRKLDHNRYSFKIFPIHENNANALAKREALFEKMSRIASDVSGVEVVRTNRDCSYPRGKQYGVAVRFQDA